MTTEKNDVVDDYSSRFAFYEKSRPRYPRVFLSSLLEYLDGRDRPEIVDLACGTGILSESISILDCNITLIEPNRNMLLQAINKFGLSPQLSGYFVAGAELLPLRDSFADAVIVGQAFHWFNFKQAICEIKRVLKPTGKLIMLWNERQRFSGEQEDVYIKLLAKYCKNQEDKDGFDIGELRRVLFPKSELSTFCFENALCLSGFLNLVFSFSGMPTEKDTSFLEFKHELQDFYHYSKQDQGMVLSYKTIALSVDANDL